MIGLILLARLAIMPDHPYAPEPGAGSKDESRTVELPDYECEKP